MAKIGIDSAENVPFQISFCCFVFISASHSDCSSRTPTKLTTVTPYPRISLSSWRTNCSTCMTNACNRKMTSSVLAPESTGSEVKAEGVVCLKMYGSRRKCIECPVGMEAASESYLRSSMGKTEKTVCRSRCSSCSSVALSSWSVLQGNYSRRPEGVPVYPTSWVTECHSQSLQLNGQCLRNAVQSVQKSNSSFT